MRRKLPDERHSITHKFSINEFEGYVTVGLYEDGQPGVLDRLPLQLPGRQRTGQAAGQPAHRPGGHRQQAQGGHRQ